MVQPADGSQYSVVHCVHRSGFVPVQVPDWQVSVCVQALLSLQVVPFAFGVTVQEEVPLQVRVLH